MLKITKLEGYALVILSHMSNGAGLQLYSAKELSKDCGLPLPTVSKIMKILAQKGLLVSHQGSLGGYKMAKPSDKTTVAEIVEVFEGPLALTDCCSTTGCQRDCQMVRGWRKLNESMDGMLRGMTLSDMANA